MAGSVAALGNGVTAPIRKAEGFCARAFFLRDSARLPAATATEGLFLRCCDIESLDKRGHQKKDELPSDNPGWREGRVAPLTGPQVPGDGGACFPPRRIPQEPQGRVRISGSRGREYTRNVFLLIFEVHNDEKRSPCILKLSEGERDMGSRMKKNHPFALQ